MENTLNELFERTLKNCSFYEKEGKTINLVNEIGVLRGIGYYCMELEGECPHTEEFMHFIEIQKKLQELDNN